MPMNGHIGVTPRGELRETAKIVGEVLQVRLIEDDSRMFDEFPAYISEFDGVRYSLLGNPDPEEDLRDSPGADFELIVEPLEGHDPAKLTEDVLRRLEADGRLNCWALM